MSIVKAHDPTTNQLVMVRARVKQDLLNTFPGLDDQVIETLDSDYRFRLILDKEYVSDVIRDKVLSIDYDNFKNSVKESWRVRAYNKIWKIMYDVQSDRYWQST